MTAEERLALIGQVGVDEARRLAQTAPPFPDDVCDVLATLFRPDLAAQDSDAA